MMRGSGATGVNENWVLGTDISVGRDQKQLNGVLGTDISVGQDEKQLNGV
jgi:hypothetical protein